MITYRKDRGIFELRTHRSSYFMQVDEAGRLLHVLYGSSLDRTVFDDRPVHHDRGCWNNLLPFECAGSGLGDTRMPSVVPEYENGTTCADFRFAEAEINKGKPELPGLPHFHGSTDTDTLVIILRDAMGLEARLTYSVYEDLDLITRSVCYVNRSRRPVKLQTAMSFCMDFEDSDYDLITFNGSWAHERTPERAHVRSGIQSVGSLKGISGHEHNPSLVLCRPDTGEEYGECWGYTLVYSGNFLAAAEKSEAGLRLLMGIHPEHFCWTLEPGEWFNTPEAGMIYSDCGFGRMSRKFHQAIREHLLPEKWSDMQKKRPVLINSWDAFYFDFDEEKLLTLARRAKKAGCDLFVLDDGWFRGRNAETTSLGDWIADERKFPNGLRSFSAKVKAIGLDFGLWFEPEAVSPESNFYRVHPEYALAIPERHPLQVRNQYNLDLIRTEVRDAIWTQMKEVIENCHVSYIKWDMNRCLSDVYSSSLPQERQGEVYHRYVLGLYDLQSRICNEFPEILLENCCSGGGRFDCGMLYYSPQIWCSDNTDAADRLMIQYGTSFIYPSVCVGAHYSESPNHDTGKTASMEARMAAALSGTFGFELDLRKYGSEYLGTLNKYTDWYHAHGELIRSGELYRLSEPAPEGGAAWMYAASDKSEVVVFAVGTVLKGKDEKHPRLLLRGLDASADYEDGEGSVISGEVLMKYGLPLPIRPGDLPAMIWYLKVVNNGNI